MTPSAHLKEAADLQRRALRQRKRGYSASASYLERCAARHREAAEGKR